MDDIGAIQLAVKVDYKQLTGLIKTTDQTKRAVSLLAKDFARTKDQSKYMSGINQIDAANRKLGNSSGMTRKQIMRLGAKVQQETKFTDALTAATKRLNVAQMNTNKVVGNTRNKMNGSNMAIQQLGYQFGDFAVQVQGGTSAFVAFSQQGSQLAGILPMIAGPLGLSMGAAVGLSAALGILIPLGSAAGRMFFEMKDSAKDAAEKTKDLKTQTDELIVSLREANELRGLGGAKETSVLSENAKELLDLEKQLNAEKLRIAPELEAIEKRRTNSADQLAIQKFQGGQTQKDIVRLEEKSLTKTRDALQARITALKILIATKKAQKDLVGDQVLENRNLMVNEARKREASEKRLTEVSSLAEAERLLGYQMIAISAQTREQRLKDISEVADAERLLGQQMLDANNKRVQKEEKENKLTEALQKNSKLQQKRNELTRIELKYGKEMPIYKYALVELEKLQLEVEQSISKEKLLAQGYDENAIILMQFNQREALKLLQIRRDIANTPLVYSMDEGSDAAQRLRKYAGRGTTSDRDPTMGGVSIYDEPKKTKAQEDADALADYIAQLKHEKMVETELVGIFGSERDIKQKILDVQKEYKDVIDENQVKEITRVLKLTDAETKRHEALQKAKEEQEALGASIEASMEKAFMSMVDGTASVKDAFKTMAREIIAELYKVLVVKKMVASISTAFGFADGGVFSGGSQVQAYADGGVVGSPTTFPMSGGKTGLMGEAGPEAIMPLKRGANGKLGVQMEGGATTTVVQNFNFSANGDDSVKRIIAQAAPKIAQMTKSEIINDRRRGGTMKATFG